MPLENTQDAPAKPGAPLIELHFEPKIDNAFVTVEWCLSQEAIAHMKEDLAQDWALIIVAQKVPPLIDATLPERGRKKYDAKKESRLVVQGLKDISVSKGILQFRGDGENEVFAFLICKNNELHDSRLFEKSIKKFERRSDGIYQNSIYLPAPDDEKLQFESGAHVQTYAAQRQVVNIPKGAFAAELSPAVKEQLDLCYLGVGEDQCAGRWRILLAYTLAPTIIGLAQIAYALLARTWLLLLGVLHFLAGGNPLVPWRPIIEPKTHPTRFSRFFMDWDFKRLPIFSGFGTVFTPAFLLLGGLVIWLGSLIGYGWPTVAFLLSFVGGLIFLHFNGDKLSENAKKKSLSKREQARLAEIELVERYATCGADNRGRGTIHLAWSGVKRSVCKPRVTA